MKYVDEFRDPKGVKYYREKIADLVKNITGNSEKTYSIMEVCGGQTHSIVKHGLDQLLPPSIRLIHGPGCPVCVTPSEIIDVAITISLRPNVVFCSFGDMLRVPGVDKSLLQAKAEGADIRTVYSPMDALQIAINEPDKEVVFLAVGFETTAPANGMAVYQAHQQGIKNFSMVVSQVTVPPAMVAILQNEATAVQGFLAAGHVCTVMGYQQYYSIADQFKVPIVVTGFEPVDVMQGLYECIRMLVNNEIGVVNQYRRSVQAKGNIPAQQLLETVFQLQDKEWRGVGTIAQSGLCLADDYQQYDALARFDVSLNKRRTESPCISGEILQGLKKPDQCPAFGKACTPEAPLGATMVSTEGACSAYYQYRNRGVNVGALNMTNIMEQKEASNNELNKA